MSAHDSTVPLSSAQKHEYYSPKSGARLAGVAAQTLRKHATPDAVVWSTTGKPYPLFTKQTLLAWAAEWHQAQGGAA